MIKVNDNVFYLNTDNTSYVFRIMPTGHLEHLYYGKSINDYESSEIFRTKHANQNGSAILYDKAFPTICMNDTNLEVSGRGTGDMRAPSIELIWPDGSNTVDFVFDSYEIIEGKNELETLPASYGDNEQVKTLKVVLKEKVYNVKLELYYSVFKDSDLITRNMVMINETDTTIKIKKLMSAQLDIPGTGYVFTTFRGDWANEMNRFDTVVRGSMVVNASRTGFSSSHSNPFVMLFSPGSGEFHGEGYGCNLVYSGQHMEIVDVGSQRQTRLITGINYENFSWNLEAGSKFETPEAVLTFSNTGYSGVSEHMHKFIRNHIVRGPWQFKERPVLLNSWEANYFNFTESRLLSLASAGKDAGIELFVMDDGWFGKRNNDTSSLGDWEENPKKLPRGIEGISKKINKMGLMFGLWVEPEMVNENSDLYRNHPDWAVKIPGRHHTEGRNQMLLDLTRTDVQEYLIDSMKKVFSSGNVSYVKWDMNRNFSDIYSNDLDSAHQEEFLHRYIIGLYRILKELVKEFPDILFESCASGGNRFDLGMLCYMPQIWASDDSDAIARCYIQNGASYGYPQSVWGAHVSSCPNHQTLRVTPLETRFRVASLGLLGYECNLQEVTKEELTTIKKQIELYKKWRKTLQYGQVYRIGGKLNKDNISLMGMEDNTNLVEWNIVSENKEEAIIIMVQDNVRPHTSQVNLRTKGLNDEYKYHFYNQQFRVNVKDFGDLINMVSPIHLKKDSFLHNMVAKFYKINSEKEDYIVSGSVLNNAGISLSQAFAGTGIGDNTRVYKDYESRMYFIERSEE